MSPSQTCTKCGKKKPVSEFTKRPDGRLKRICKACVRVYSAEHYQRTKDRYKRSRYASKLAARDRRKEIIEEAKDRPCADCGVSYPPYVMDFDHRKPKKKRFAIGHTNTLGIGEKRLREELKKCDVVCANCHRERTHQQGQRSRRAAGSGNR